jgi:hypothetical protein
MLPCYRCTRVCLLCYFCVRLNLDLNSHVGICVTMLFNGHDDAVPLNWCL